MCRLLITVARASIDAVVAAQPPRLRAEAEAAQRRVNDQFQQLERQIDQTANQVRQALEARRERAMQAVDQALAEIQAENASLLDRLVAFINAIVDALGKFFKLMVRITEMGIGTFLGRALDQASSGVRNHLWNELKQAFKEWIFMKLSFLQPLLLLPSNVLEVLAQAAMNLANLFFEALPEALPAIGVAAMTWLAIQLAAKLIPGVGAIMAVIDAIRAAWSLIQSLIRAASAFFEFIMLVAGGGDGSVQFARALAWGIIAAVDALLTFLGVDALLRRIARPLGRPMGRIFGRLRERFARRRTARQSRRRRRDDDDRRVGSRRGDGQHRARSERSRARADRRAEARRDRTRAERRTARSNTRNDARRRSDDPNRRRQERDRRRRQERERRNRERLERARRELPPRINRLLAGRPSRLRLLAQLTYWRLRYRLSSLRVHGSERYDIIARVNPQVTLAPGWAFEWRDVVRVLDRVADEMITTERARQTQSPPTTSPEGTTQLTMMSPATAAVARQPGRTFQVGDSGLAYRDQPARGFWSRLGVREIAGAGTGQMSYYPALQRAFAGAPRGAVGESFTRALRRQGGAPLSEAHRGAAGEMFGLWFAHEPSHRSGTFSHRRDLMYSTMLSELMTPGAQGQRAMSTTSAIGLHPASFGGAQQGARQVTAEMNDPNAPLPREGTDARRNRDERLRREKSSLIAWFQRHRADLPQLNRAPTLEDVESFVRRKVADYLAGRRGP